MMNNLGAYVPPCLHLTKLYPAYWPCASDLLASCREDERESHGLGGVLGRDTYGTYGGRDTYGGVGVGEGQDNICPSG